MSGIYLALSVLHGPVWSFQGRRATLRAALAPGYHIPRLWRWTSSAPTALDIFRACGAGHLPRLRRWASSAPVALDIFRACGAGHLARLRRWASSAPAALGILRAYGAGRGLNSDFQASFLRL